MDFKTFLNHVLTDTKVKLTEAFDRNFERKGFFNQKWPETKLHNRRGSLMIRTGTLRRSIRSTIEGSSVRWTSAVPYAQVHNNGGEIEVTAKMKRYFWAMYYKATNASKGNKNNKNLPAEALRYKALALKKVGDKLSIPKRQFIGDHPEVKRMIDEIVGYNLNEVFKNIKP
ncbi:phage virion morphogenesis protein [Capnocytophaga granulosa]|uniref:phage virion morphogenesis protein n=1 Tax=Capnocytophaga granulosa TaxID=45242 RepID=UPI0028E4D6E5|nr:phage virion morphogenesis protein [Capnocytophaga granulosa]